MSISLRRYDDGLTVHACLLFRTYYSSKKFPDVLKLHLTVTDTQQAGDRLSAVWLFLSRSRPEIKDSALTEPS